MALAYAKYTKSWLTLSVVRSVASNTVEARQERERKRLRATWPDQGRNRRWSERLHALRSLGPSSQSFTVSFDQEGRLLQLLQASGKTPPRLYVLLAVCFTEHKAGFHGRQHGIARATLVVPFDLLRWKEGNHQPLWALTAN